MFVNPQHVVLFHNFRLFLEKASKQGVDVAPLKGAHLITSVYPAAEDRGPMADVDFLVRPNDWQKTCEILAEMGFVRKKLSGRKISDRTYHEAHFYLAISNRERILFEPHRALVQEARHSIDYDALWSRAVPSTFDGAPCLRLAAEDHVLHTAVHLVTHFFCLPKTWMRDMELLLTAGGADLNIVVERAAKWKVRRALWTALSLLAESGVRIDLTAALRRTAPPPWIRSCLRFLVPDASGFRFPRLHLRAKEAIFWPLFLDGAKAFASFAAFYAKTRLQDFLSNLQRQ